MLHSNACHLPITNSNSLSCFRYDDYEISTAISHGRYTIIDGEDKYIRDGSVGRRKSDDLFKSSMAKPLRQLLVNTAVKNTEPKVRARCVAQL